MITLPRLGRFTQGSIFCGAFAEGYEAQPVWGVVITARCDAAHDKIPVVNYVPLVRMEDWLARDGGLLIVERALGESKGRFIGLLERRGLSKSLLEVYSPTQIARAHFKDVEISVKGSSRLNAESEQARKVASEIEECQAILRSQQVDAERVYRLIQSKTKLCSAVVAELMSHKVNGYYFIQNIGELSDHTTELGYVAILREVRYLPTRFAKLVLDGVTKDDAVQHKAVGHICLDVFDFVCFIAEIRSPWIEHMMQVFCNMFGRIGIDDVDKALVQSVVNAVAPAVGEGK